MYKKKSKKEIINNVLSNVTQKISESHNTTITGEGSDNMALITENQLFRKLNAYRS